jgi:hypothetical protein
MMLMGWPRSRTDQHLGSSWGQLLAWPPAGVFAWHGNRSPTHFGGGARALGSHRVSWPTHQSELGGGRARRRLVVQGGDLSCEAETCRGDPSCRELVGDAANWSETWHLASAGLDQGPQSSSSWILALMLSILAFTLSTVLGYLVLKGDLFTVKGALIRALVSSPRAWEGVKESRLGLVGRSECWWCSSCSQWVRASASAGCSPRGREWVEDSLASFYVWL